MKLHVLKYDASERGCPLVLKGDLNADWEWDTFYPNPERFEVTHNYQYVSKNPVIDFDYWNEHSIGSSRFVDLCRDAGARIRTAPLKIVQSNKKRTDKDYFYLLWSDWLSIIDPERSDAGFDRDIETNAIIHQREFPTVPRYSTIRRFVADAPKLGGKQVFKCVDLDFELVCTEEFRENCVRSNLTGLQFVPLAEYQKIPWYA